MKTEEIKEVIERFKAGGVNVRVRDIAYTVLSKVFEPNTAYNCLFGSDGFEDYSKDPVRSNLETYMRDRGYLKSENDLTFEENRRQMILLIDRFEKDMRDGLIDPAVGLSKISDIRVRLNDKFKVSEEKQDRTIVVQKKFNDVCSCGREIYVPTKEDLMEKYNLIEKTT